MSIGNIYEKRDGLTGLYLLESCESMWNETAEIAELYGENICITSIFIGGLQQVEDTDGPVEKDRLLVAFSDILSKSCSSREDVFRVNDTGFAIIGSESNTDEHYSMIMERVKKQFGEQLLLMNNPCYLYIKHDMKIIPCTNICNAKQAIAKITKMLQHLVKEAEPSLSEQFHYSEFIKLRREIYMFPEKEWSIEYCSRCLNISESYFHKLYRRIFGENCMNDVKKSRMNCAKKLLMTTNETLQSIAEKCGYDYAHFMRIFKKEIGITPTQYRRGKQN